MSVPDAPLPSVLGGYKVIARLASGGMGTVHLARTPGRLGFSRAVALKTLHPHLLADRRLVLRFLDEARLASRIQHPNVIPVIDVGHEHGSVFLVMEYVHGASLSSLLGERIPEPIVAAIARDVLAGLAAAHEATDEAGRPLRIVHRDVSPQNILVSVQGVAYLTDFGIAKARDGLGQTESAEVLGKVAYMAPEQIAGTSVTVQADLFAVGAVLWEMLAGEKLVEGLGAQGLPSFTERVAKLGAAAPSSPGLASFVSRLLAPSPDRRPTSARIALRELLEVARPAPAEDVSDWVRDRAEARLAKLDALLQESSPEAGARDEALRFVDRMADGRAIAPTVPSPHHPPGTFEATILLPTSMVARTASGATPVATRSRAVELLAVAVVVLGLVGAGLFVRLRARPIETTAAAASPPAATSASAPATPTPSAVAATASAVPEAKGPTASIAVAPPSSTTKPLRAPTAKPKTAPACDPPFVYDERGVKRYIPGCFREGP